jgi:hypothetical protein
MERYIYMWYIQNILTFIIKTLIVFFLTYYLIFIIQFNQKMLINLWRFILEIVHLRLAHKHGVGDSRAPFVFGIALVLT